MIMKMYSIKDEINGFLQPTFELYEPAALRNFSYAVNQPGLINENSSDYSLWYIADFDCEKGIIVSSDPHLVVHASEVVK